MCSSDLQIFTRFFAISSILLAVLGDYLVFIIAIFYFMAIRPQSKEKKKQAELMATVAVGDSVLTSSGFYGVIIDMTDDTVIVEFGSNKNCRIPMRKDAIVQVEKPEV